MKLRNKLIPLLAIIPATVAPIATGCSCKTKTTKTLPTPGSETTYEKALEWVSNWSQVTKSGSRIVRNNLAKSVEFNLSTSQLSIDGTGVSTHYEKQAGNDQWFPITKLNPVQLSINSELEFGYTLNNERAAFSAVDILSIDEKTITAESPTYDRICDFIFNPFLYKTTFEDLHKLTSYNSTFKETFTYSGDCMYITYDIEDLESLMNTQQIKSLLASETPCFIPFRGTGSLSISFGFNKHGYMTYGRATANSDYLEIYTSPTSGKYPLRPTFFGAVKGNLAYDALVTNFIVPRIHVNVNGTALADPQDRDPGTPTAPQWVNPELYEFAEASEYYVSFKNQSYKVLPGYGATVVIQAPETWNVNNLGFKIGNATYTYDDIGPKGSGEVVMTSYKNSDYGNAHTYVFYLKAPTFDLIGNNSFIEINLTSN